jgi:hypothetical protein
MNRCSWFGIALLVTGCLLLLVELDWLSVSGSVVFWLIVAGGSAVFLVRSLRAHRCRGVVVSALLFAIGVLAVLDQGLHLSFDPAIVTALLVGSAGVAFGLIWAGRRQEWQYLVLAAVGIATGLAIAVVHTEYLTSDAAFRALKIGAPIASILIGIFLLLPRRPARPQ